MRNKYAYLIFLPKKLITFFPYSLHHLATPSDCSRSRQEPAIAELTLGHVAATDSVFEQVGCFRKVLKVYSPVDSNQNQSINGLRLMSEYLVNFLIIKSNIDSRISLFGRFTYPGSLPDQIFHLLSFLWGVVE
jgi:hypothetical protein